LTLIHLFLRDLLVTVNTIAECVRTDSNSLGDYYTSKKRDRWLVVPKKCFVLGVADMFLS